MFSPWCRVCTIWWWARRTSRTARTGSGWQPGAHPTQPAPQSSGHNSFDFTGQLLDCSILFYVSTFRLGIVFYIRTIRVVDNAFFVPNSFPIHILRMNMYKIQFLLKCKFVFLRTFLKLLFIKGCLTRYLPTEGGGSKAGLVGSYSDPHQFYTDRHSRTDYINKVKK